MIRRLWLTLKYTTWDFRKFGKDNEFCLNLFQAYQLAKIISGGKQ